MCREQSKVNDDRRISKLATVLIHISMCLFIFQHKIIPYLNLCFIHNQSLKSVSCCLHISCHWVILWIMLCLLFNPQMFRLNHWLTFHRESFLLISGKISILSPNTHTHKNLYLYNPCKSKSSAWGWNFPTASHCAWRNAQENRQVHRRAN